MTHRSSFSQHSTFEKCPRMWFFQKIKKIPVIQDFCYANGGKCVHNTLEQYYKGTFSNLEEAKIHFKEQWKKFKLDIHHKFKFKLDEYWLMVINGVNLAVSVTDTELKIYFPDCIGYLDTVDKKNLVIRDWKSSTRTKEKDNEYTKQGLIYAWLYLRKFGVIPKEVVFHYLRYNGTRGSLSFVPTEDEVKNIKHWYEIILNKMDRIKQTGETPLCVQVCDPWCSFTDICKGQEVGKKVFNIECLGSYIRLNGPINNIINVVLDKTFSYELKNSFWIKKNRPKFDGIIRFWNQRKQTLPYGFKDKLINILENYGKKFGHNIEINYIDKRVFNSDRVNFPDKVLNGIVLRDYQNEAVNVALKNKLGLLEIGTGGGKTAIMAEVIRQANMKTLVVVDKIELLRQTKKVFEDTFGLEVGQLGGGELDTSKFITVATIQTINKNIVKYIPFLMGIRMVIFDEAHHVASNSFVKLGRYLPNTEYRIGVSGTCTRDDGNDMQIHSVTGFKIFDLSSKTLIEKGWLVKPTIRFIKNYMPKEEILNLELNTKEGLINETDNYAGFYEQFIYLNKWRNKVIKKLVEENKGKKILVLTKLVAHGDMLANELGGKHLYGGTNKEERKKLFEDFTKGDLNILVSTVSIWSEGLDCPPLKVIINCSANKGNVKTIQMLGRVLRTLSGKKNALYYDFIDESRFFRTASYARQRALKNQGHDIEIIDGGKNETN